VAAQTLRLACALTARWVVADGVVCNYGWFVRHMLRASILATHLELIQAVSSGGTSWETQAETIHAKKRVEEQEQPTFDQAANESSI